MEAVNKLSSCSDGSKSVTFVPVKSEQQFKIKSHFGIFYHSIGEGQLYDDASSQALKFICGLFGNILFFYPMRLVLDISRFYLIQN